MKQKLFTYSIILSICIASLFFGGIMLYLGVTQYSEIRRHSELYDIVSGFLYDYEVIEKLPRGLDIGSNMPITSAEQNTSCTGMQL